MTILWHKLHNLHNLCTTHFWPPFWSKTRLKPNILTPFLDMSQNAHLYTWFLGGSNRAPAALNPGVTPHFWQLGTWPYFGGVQTPGLTCAGVTELSKKWLWQTFCTICTNCANLCTQNLYKICHFFKKLQFFWFFSKIFFFVIKFAPENGCKMKKMIFKKMQFLMFSKMQNNKIFMHFWMTYPRVWRALATNGRPGHKSEIDKIFSKF